MQDVLTIIKSLYSTHNFTAKNRKRFVPHFPVLHFPALLFGPPNSSPAFSVAPAALSGIGQCDEVMNVVAM